MLWFDYRGKIHEGSWQRSDTYGRLVQQRGGGPFVADFNTPADKYWTEEDLQQVLDRLRELNRRPGTFW